MCNKAVDAHPPTIKYVPECYKTQEMCNKAVLKWCFVFDSIADQYKTQEICDIVVSLHPYVIVYCPDKYITQKMFYEAVDDSFSNSIETYSRLVCYADDDLLFFDEDSGDVTFCCDKTGILSVNLNNINLDNNFG